MTIQATDDLLNEIDHEEESICDKVIDDLSDFRAALGQAQVSDRKELTVTGKIMRHLVGNAHETAITYGTPGVTIYLEKK